MSPLVTPTGSALTLHRHLALVWRPGSLGPWWQGHCLALGVLLQFSLGWHSGRGCGAELQGEHPRPISPQMPPSAPTQVPLLPWMVKSQSLRLRSCWGLC